MISLLEFPARPLLLRYQNSRDAERESPIDCICTHIVKGRLMPLSKLYDEALLYASDLHRMQVRKGSGTPYIAHLLSVSSRVLSAGGTEVQAIAGLLHDAAEDQGGQATLDDVRRRFGSDVAQIVADCTDSWSEPKPAWRPRKELYLSLLPKKAITSLLVSLADKVDNAEAILNDYRNIGDNLWGRFTGGREGTIWYYRGLSEIFSTALPGALARQLALTVSEFPSEQP
jgi:(p)ppGpp synthase/HD superfamily hydrolase